MSKTQDLISCLLVAEDSDSAGMKAAATKKLNKYVGLRESEGKDPKMVRAGIKAYITRLKNEKN